MDTQQVNHEYFEDLQVKQKREALLVGNLGTRVIAWGIVKQYSTRPGYQYACETSVYVADEFKNRGYGSKLLHALISRARSLGYRHLVAKILAVNKSSIRFHQHIGFEVVGRQRDIGFLNGTWHDIIIMQRILDVELNLPKDEVYNP